MTKRGDIISYCRDCKDYVDGGCGNTNSDHYGHVLAPFHPICEEAGV